MRKEIKSGNGLECKRITLNIRNRLQKMNTNRGKDLVRTALNTSRYIKSISNLGVQKKRDIVITFLNTVLGPPCELLAPSPMVVTAIYYFFRIIFSKLLRQKVIHRINYLLLHTKAIHR